MQSAEDIARVCHEANRAYCQTIGDNSQKSWEDADQWQRDSATTAVTYRLTYPDATPELQHEAWMRQKTADGWGYGPVKDPEKKEHPCMVAYSDLPAEQRIKDHLFQAVVDVLR